MGSVQSSARAKPPSRLRLPRRPLSFGDLATVTSLRADRPICRAADRSGRRGDGRRLGDRPRHRPRLRRLRREGGHLGARTPRRLPPPPRRSAASRCRPTSVSPAEVDRALERTVAELGPVSILVNNAGGVFSSPLLETSENGWDALYRANLKHVILCTQTGGPGHGRARHRWQHHERDLHRGCPGRAGLCRLCRRQGGRHQLHEDRRPRAGAISASGSTRWRPTSP